MKRRYLAMVLGMALAIGPVNVMAEETDSIATESAGVETETAAEEELVGIAVEDGEFSGELSGDEAVSDQFWGEVKSVDETGITISIGTFGEEFPADGMELPEEASDGAELPADDAELSDAEQSADDAELSDAEVAADDAELSEDGQAAEVTDDAEVSDDAAGTENEQPESMSVYEAFELTGEEMTIPITEDTEVYFIYGDSDFAGLHMTARKFAADEEFELGVTVDENEESTADAEVTDVESTADAEATDAEGAADAEVTDAESTADAETTDAESTAAAEEVTDAESTADADVNPALEGAMNPGAELTVESATVESILPEDVVNITLDEEGNAAVILIVLPDEQAEA